jgi:hypothetical protein
MTTDTLVPKQRWQTIQPLLPTTTPLRRPTSHRRPRGVGRDRLPAPDRHPLAAAARPPARLRQSHHLLAAAAGLAARRRGALPWPDVVLGPDPRHRAVADAQLAGQQPRGPVGHPERLGRWGEGGGQDLSPPIAAHSLGAATARSVGQACGQSLPHMALAPGNHRWARDAQPLGDLAVGHALGGSSRILARWTSAAGAWAALAQRRKTAWSLGLMGKAAAEAGIRRHFHYPPTVKSPQRHTTRSAQHSTFTPRQTC